jgi:hypothetical protein
MSVGAISWPARWRAAPWGVWLLLALGVLVILLGLTQPAPALLSVLAASGSLFFAAAVLYVAPADRRITWGAVALASVPTVTIIANLVPQVWFEIMPGDWKNATPMVADLAHIARQISSYFAMLGLYLLGIGLGGVRSFVPFLILLLGVMVAVANVGWTLSNTFEGFPLFELTTSLVFATLNPVGLAFVFAAAVESLRNLTLVGAGLRFGGSALSSALLWWTIGPNVNTDLLSLLLGSVALGGWLALIAGALRGELSGAPARSRAGRGSGARRRVG